MKAAIYARVSKEEQAEEGASIDQQIDDMEALCKRNGWQVDHVFVDCENYRATQNPSKGKMVNPSGERADRPALLNLLEKLKTGELDAVVCWRDDRLVRHPRVAVALEDALDFGDSKRNGRPRIGLCDATGATIDRFTLSIKATVWREENKRRAERSQMGKIATLRQGRWPGIYERLGYDAIKEGGLRGRRIILADESEVQTVQDIFSWYDQGVGTFEIRRRLLAGNRSPKRDPDRRSHEWANAVLCQILRSEDYTGATTWRFTDGTEYTIEIPRIIEPEQFNRVQKRLESNKKLSMRNSKHIFLLHGILKCGECDSTMSAGAVRYRYSTEPDGSRKRHDYPTPYHRYRCAFAGHFPDEPHPSPACFSGVVLDWEVWRYIVDNGIKQPDAIKKQVLAHREELRSQGENVDGEIAHVRCRLDEVVQERAFYQRQAARSKITEAEFDVRMEETEFARLYWQEEIDRLKQLRDDAAQVQCGLDYATDLLISVQARLPEIDQTPEELRALPEEQQVEILKRRREIIRALAQKVVIWHDKRVEIFGLIDGTERAQFNLVGPWRRWAPAV
jgi:DNA invertase Pin-like site-specific DNA recombinase